MAGGGTASVLAVGEPGSGWAERFGAAGASFATGGAPSGPPFEADAWVVDGYALPAELPEALGRRGPVTVIDDGGRRGRYDAAWVLDQNLGADDGPYGDRPSTCRLLLGTRYALLRDDVTAGRPEAVPDRSGAPARLLVALGGAPSDAARAVFDAVASPERLGELGLERVDLAGVSNVGSVLAGVDLALSAAGSTVWELAAWGIPTVAVVIADNQRVVARRAGAAGLVVDGGDTEDLDPDELYAVLSGLVADRDRRQALAERAWTTVDGRGAARVAAALRGSLLRVRPATADDEGLLWGWANDPAVRSSSFSPEPIPLEDHRTWLASRLADPASRLAIVELSDGIPLGQVRLDIDGDRARLDYSIEAGHRGAGWAAPMLDAAIRSVWDDPALGLVARIDAEVRPGNDASSRALRAADFVAGPDGSAEGRRWHTYTRPRHG